MIKCPHCSNEINQADYSKGLSFCPYCGGDLKTPKRSGPPLAFCPYCGNDIGSDMKYCPSCGKEIPVPHPNEVAVMETGSAQLVHKGEAIISSAGKAVKGVFSADRKTKKLYKQWVDNAGLSPDDIPSFEDEMGAVPTSSPERAIGPAGIPLVYIILGASVILFIALIIVVVMIT